jgi:hypothetical protein
VLKLKGLLAHCARLLSTPLSPLPSPRSSLLAHSLLRSSLLAPPYPLSPSVGHLQREADDSSRRDSLSLSLVQTIPSSLSNLQREADDSEARPVVHAGDGLPPWVIKM